MNQGYSEQIEIDHKQDGSLRLTVSGNHAVNLLTFLQQKGIQASGQDAPLFGLSDFPTIYYILFNIKFDVLCEEIADYLKVNSFSFIIQPDENDTQKSAIFKIRTKQYEN